eukprot:1152781-Pyramimonas_sp.AAC.1
MCIPPRHSLDVTELPAHEHGRAASRRMACGDAEGRHRRAASRPRHRGKLALLAGAELEQTWHA